MCSQLKVKKHNLTIVLTFKCILKHHKANVANNDTFLDILMQKKKQICAWTTIAGVMVDEHLYWNPWFVLIHQETNCKNFLKMILLLLVDHELINIQILRVEYHGCNKEWVNASCDAQIANWRSQKQNGQAQESLYQLTWGTQNKNHV